MSQYLLTCDSDYNAANCALSTYNPGPAPTEHGFQHGTLELGIWILGALLVLIIIGAAVVRWKAHEERSRRESERAQVERVRLENPPKDCPVCGYDGHDLVTPKRFLK